MFESPRPVVVALSFGAVSVVACPPPMGRNTELSEQQRSVIIQLAGDPVT